MPGNLKQQALSAAMVRTVNRPGMYADGNGLNLKVVSSGAKRWVQRVTIGGKRHNLGLGGYSAVSLAEARELAAENQRAIRQGRDPLAEKHLAEEDLRRPPVPAFTQAAEQVIEMRRPTWSNTKHASQWENTLRTYAHPVIGRRMVDEITTSDILAILTPIWTHQAGNRQPGAATPGDRTGLDRGPGLEGGQSRRKGHSPGPAPNLPAQEPSSGPSLWRCAGCTATGPGVHRRPGDPALLRVPGPDRCPVR